MDPAVRQHTMLDPHYPRYHAAPPVGWMNDPHPIWFKGAYHMFYQYSFIPDRPYDGPHCWGHMVSRDLIRWTDLPNAITPKDHGIAPDRHIWSGCLVDNNGVGTAIYTMENIDIWVATSHDDDLATFKKYDGNPVVKGPPPGLDIMGEIRDPWVWKEDDGWYMVIGSGLTENRGPVLPLYRSDDLIHWEYLHPLYQGDPKTDTIFCECPAFFPLGDAHVLAMSHQATYLTGDYKEHRFTPATRGRLDYGCIYVPQTVLDDKGRRILFGWVHEARDYALAARAGWISMQTLPRVLTMGPDGLLRYAPVEEIETLRKEHVAVENKTLGSEALPLEIEGAQLEIILTLDPAKSEACGLRFRQGDVTAEVFYERETQSVRCRACVDYTAPLPVKPGETVTLRVFLDGSVIEVFAEERVCITNRTYPPHPSKTRVELFARGAEAKLVRADAWKLTVESETK